MNPLIKNKIIKVLPIANCLPVKGTIQSVNINGCTVNGEVVGYGKNSKGDFYLLNIKEVAK